MNKADKNKIASKVIFYVLAIVVALIPLLVSVSLRLLSYGTKIQFHIPLYTDECVYWSQLDTMVNCGKPFGYFGYLGSRGILGNWSTWGPGIIVPYFLFAKVFGLSYSTMYWANLFYLGLSIFLFIVITKLPIKKFPILAVAILVSPILLKYSVSSMAESFRQAYGIIIAACMFRLLKYETTNIYKYVVLPILIVVGMMTFVMHGLWLGIYFIYVLKDIKINKYVRLLLSIMGMGIVSVFTYIINYLFSAPFYGGNIGDVVEVYNRTKSVVEAIRFFIKSTIARFFIYDVVHILQEMTIQRYFILVFWILVATLLIYLFMNKASLIEKQDELICVYMLLMTYAIYLVIYTQYEGNLVRGLSIAVVNSVFWMIASENKYFYVIYIVCLGLVFFTTYEETGAEFKLRSSYKEEINVFKGIKDNLTEIMKIDENGDGWANTVDVYGTNYQLDIMIPSGFGINQVWDDYVVDSNSRWSVLYTTCELNKDFEELGYELKYQDELVTVYYNK